MCCPLVFEFSVGIGGFVIGVGQISFFFSSFKHVKEKLMNDRSSLFLFKTLKLVCSNICVFILLSYINVCIELRRESHLRTTVYTFTLDWI